MSEAMEELKERIHAIIEENARLRTTIIILEDKLERKEKEQRKEKRQIIKVLKDYAIEFEVFGQSGDYIELSHAIEIVKRGGRK